MEGNGVQENSKTEAEEDKERRTNKRRDITESRRKIKPGRKLARATKHKRKGSKK
jgi:hypothetical protein